MPCDEGHLADHVPIDKTAGWEARKKKYEAYARHGKVKKLEKVKGRQVEKAEKAKHAMYKLAKEATPEKQKKADYYHYKCAKIEWTEACIKVAKLAEAMATVRAPGQGVVRGVGCGAACARRGAAVPR